MPAPLKEELEALAKQNRRSLTAEIVARLEESVASEREPVTKFRGIDKNALMATVGESATYSEQTILEAMRMALRAVAPDNARPEPNSGPKPRKR